jgi:dihydrofolate reductase
VLTRDPAFSAAGAEVVATLAEGLRRVGGPHKTVTWDAWVLGGASVYVEALPLVDVAVITEIDQPFDGDVVAPRLGADWVESGPTPEWSTSENRLRYRIRRFDRASG